MRIGTQIRSTGRRDHTRRSPLLPTLLQPSIAPLTGHIDRRLSSIPISGRDDDLTEINRRASSWPQPPFSGVGGLGKSRLAAEMIVT